MCGCCSPREDLRWRRVRRGQGDPEQRGELRPRHGQVDQAHQHEEDLRLRGRGAGGQARPLRHRAGGLNCDS